MDQQEKLNFVIIHGTQGSPQGNWFPWLSEELKMRGHNVKAPQFPTPENQSLDAWLATFEAQVGRSNLNSRSVLIGHSCGVPCALRILEQAVTSIKASFLVAGLTGQLGLPEFDDLNRTFVSAPFQWNQIRKFAGEVFVYHATNDPYVPIEQAYEIGKGLGVQVKEIQNGGHLNAEFGYTQFEELLCDIDSLAL